MRYVQVTEGVAGFLVGGRFLTRADGPFAVEDDERAAALLKAGLVEGCLPPQALPADAVHDALHPAPKAAEKAVRKRCG